MKRIYPLLCTSLLIAASALPGSAQTEHACAKSRPHVNREQAMATPGHLTRMLRYDVKFYHLDIALERTSRDVGGKTTIQAQITAPLDTFSFELHQNLLIDSVKVNGQLRPVQRMAAEASVPLPASLAAGQTISTEIFYHGTAPNASTGNGLISTSAPNFGSRITYNVSQPFEAHHWWPCKQVLDDKADSVYVFITTSADNKAGSNGVLTAEVPLPNNKKRFEWKSRYPINYYLVSVAVAQYQEYTIYANPAGSPQPIPIVNYLYNLPQVLPALQTKIDETGPLLENFSGKFGLYPFHLEKYGHCMAPIGGGMEHQTMSTQGIFEIDVLAHELAHQWFGDHVGLAGWSDIWLSEGFAMYAEYLALHDFRSPATARTYLNTLHNSVVVQPGGSVYVADSTNGFRIFNFRLSYQKAGMLVHMLRYEVNNDSLFYATLRTYVNTYGGGTARTGQLKQLMEQAIGRSFTTFFNQWFYGEGFPTFALRWNQLGGQLLLRSTQTVSMPAVTQLFTTPVEYKLLRSTGDTVIRVMHGQPVEHYAIPMSGTITGIEVDPNQWILNKTGTMQQDSTLISASPAALATRSATVYPNPFGHIIRLSDLPTTSVTATLHDVLGREVLRLPVTGSSAALAVPGLPAGVYILRLSSAQGEQVLKVVKE